MYNRSFSLVSAQNSLLLLIDIQERLVPSVYCGDMLVFNVQRLITAANTLGTPVIVSEQYPEKLGATVPGIGQILLTGTKIFTKKAFSVCAVPEFVTHIENEPASKIIICGVELHVCVLQSAFDLILLGKEVVIVTDACACRFRNDYEMALRRLESAGATLSTTETIMFEWCETANNTAFRTISKLAKERLS
ncbi:MAG: isochorismatase family protein [Planctomycetaceae bacterium]|jgi:nicotinamidase-related amidase|nr:isochorismatase family protein [Planctomycetaceae bacterium]